jgi:branched-chain amino acid transport system ATP-binding protein
MSTDATITANQATSSTTPHLLEVREIEVRFGGVSAIDGASLSVAPGEVCGLIGPNGAGKTTLFDVISGIRTPQGGKVFLEGTDITGWDPIKRSHAGMRRTFQVVQMFAWLSVLENVTAALDWEGGGGGFLADLVAFPTRTRRNRERHNRARAVLDACGLSEIADKPAGSLPIGLARMVELARATVDNPKVILLDEPTSGLDHNESQRLAERMRKMSRDSGCGVLLVEHDMDFLMRQCDRVVVLNLGQILAEGTPEEIRSDPAVRAAYLGG